MFPFAPSVMVIVPVVEFPVFNVTSWSPLDLNIPAALPDPTLNSVKAPVDVVLEPIAVPSIVPASISTLLISTSPLPLGVMAMFPFAPSVMVMVPVVEFPVFRVRSWSPLDLNIPAALPVPPATSPSITTVPSAALVIVSSF